MEAQQACIEDEKAAEDHLIAKGVKKGCKSNRTSYAV